MPSAEHPAKVLRHTEPWRAATLLTAWAQLLGRDRRWAPKLVLPPWVLERLLLEAPATREALAEVLGDWRDALVGDDLWSLWTGASTLGLDMGTGFVAEHPRR